MRVLQNELLCTFPRIETSALKNGQVRIRNAEFGVVLDAPLSMLEVLKFFRRPKRVSALRKEYEGVPIEILEHLKEHFLLFQEPESTIFANVSVRRTLKTSVGRSVTINELSTKPPSKNQRRIAVFGAGVDMAAEGDGGARHGPKAIRAVFPIAVARPKTGKPSTAWDLEYRRRTGMGGLDVVDVGDVQLFVGESSSQFGDRVAWFANLLSALGCFPIGLGGDHSVTRFMLRPFIRKGAPPFGIVHFDAHTDLYQAPKGAISHGNPFDEALASGALQQLLQVGPRQLRDDRTTAVVDRRLSWVSSLEVWQKSPEQVFANLRRDIPHYVTFDVDCMSAAECPETGTPVPGGLQYYHALTLFDWLLQNVTLVGADFMEVAGPVSPRNQSALVTANLAARVILSHAKHQVLDSQLFRAEALNPFGLIEGR